MKRRKKHSEFGELWTCVAIAMPETRGQVQFEQRQPDSRVSQNNFISCPKLGNRLAVRRLHFLSLIILCLAGWFSLGKPVHLSAPWRILCWPRWTWRPNYYFKILGFYIAFFLKKKKKKKDITRNILSQITVFHSADDWHVISTDKDDTVPRLLKMQLISFF